MNKPAIAATVALSVALAFCPLGCRKPPASGGGENATAPAPAPPTAPVGAVAPTAGPAGELQVIAAGWRDLTGLMQKSPLPYPTIEAKSWLVAACADELLKIAARTKDPDAKSPDSDLLLDVELVGMNAKRLALAAATWDGAATRENWDHLDRACRRVCPAQAGAADSAPAGKKP